MTRDLGHRVFTRALADLTSGQLREPVEHGGDLERRVLDDMAAAVSEVFNHGTLSWDVLFSRLGERSATVLDNLVLISKDRIYAAHRELDDRSTCQLAIASRENSVGFVLSQIRERRAPHKRTTSPNLREKA